MHARPAGVFTRSTNAWRLVAGCHSPPRGSGNRYIAAPPHLASPALCYVLRVRVYRRSHKATCKTRGKVNDLGHIGTLRGGQRRWVLRRLLCTSQLN